jgi:hypothetical protein
MNIQSEIKSRCQELLKEQKISRREMRELISRAAFTMRDPTRCLEPWDWTFDWTYNNEGKWSKIFTLPYPLLTTRKGLSYLQEEVVIALWFCSQYISLWIKPYPEPKPVYYLHSGCVYYLYSGCDVQDLRSDRKVSSILQKTNIELSKIISSLKTKSFYDETNQERVEIIPISEFITKIDQIFREICKAHGAKPS